VKDLFGKPLEVDHDPGGKIMRRLPPGIEGAALFHGPGKRFRTSLTRRWQKGDRFALWIGMNPSTASPIVDDPTCQIEWMYSREKLGVDFYIKANVMDVRCTQSRLLPAMTQDERCSEHNLPEIEGLITRARVVIAAWGLLPKSLRHHANAVEQLAAKHGVQLQCLGRTKDGSPRHPLFVARSTPLQPYP
jgi:hypothetical protein